MLLMRPKPPPNRKQVSQTASLPPPIGGLNARDALSDLDPKDALLLDNFFPENNSIHLRRGHLEHTDTGTAAAVRSLMTYGASDGDQILLAASGGSIFDATASAITLETGFANNDWQYVNFATAGGQFLIMVNGVDELQRFDGSVFVSSAFTASGLTTSTLANVCSHKERIWLAQADTLNAWYGDTESVAGTLSKFPLGGVADLGGSLLALGTMSTTAGTTVDDFLAFVTDQGEVLLYQGTDPSSDATWALAGRYRIGKPIGRRCLVRIGGDLVVISTEGALSIRKSLEFARGQQDRAAVTDKIQDSFNSAARSYAGNFGWQALVYPKGHRVLFNIPVGEDASQYQFVMNANTGAWCRFTGMMGGCWALLDDELYFGGNDGIVYKADVGYQDNGAPITGQMKGAFNFFGKRTQQKYFTMLRPIFTSNGSPAVTISIGVDYGNAEPGASITPAETTSAVWGVSLWGTGQWGGGERLTKNWQSVGALGFCGAIGMKIVSNGQSAAIQGFDLVGQPGGVL